MLIVGRLYSLQVVEHERYSEMAVQKYSVIELDGPRGTIYDARGRELAISVPAPSIYAVPNEVEDPAATVAALARVLPLAPAERRVLERRLSSDSTFAWVKRQLEPEVASMVQALGLPAIHVRDEPKRYYPNGSLASQVIGFVGVDHQGLAGLEVRYDETIAGSTLRRTARRGRNGGYVLDDRTLEELARSGSGAALHLTLDATLQHLAERELARMIEATRARAGVVVALDPADSAVLAMASLPNFDPNDVASSGPEDRRNRAVMDAYDPGSTFKVVTAASVLENMVLHPDDLLDCEMGSLVVQGTRIRDHKAYDILTFSQVLEKSSNVGVMKAALRLGGGRFLETTERFGVGQRTGIDLPGEQTGQIRRQDWNRDIMVAYASFGQGITLTPLQVANFFAAVANGGTLHRPYVVRAIERDGRNIDLRRESLVPDGPLAGAPVRRAISEQTAQTLLRILEGVVTDGTAKRAAVPGYRVAGKTGTAEKTSRHGVSKVNKMASFVGVVPARNPRLVVLVMLDEPRGLTHGGTVAAPVFASMTREALVYLGVAPDEDTGSDATGTESAAQIARFTLPLLPDGSPSEDGAEATEAETRVASLAAGGGR